jgi:hypothetical protein
MPRDPVLKKAVEKPNEVVAELRRHEEFNGENIGGPKRLQKSSKRSVSPTPDEPAPAGHYGRSRAHLTEQLDLYEGLRSAPRDDRPRQVQPSRRKSTVTIRCPLCGSEIRIVEIALTMECPGCHAIVDVLEVARVGQKGVVPPPGRSRRSVPAQIESRWQAAEPILPEALPSFFVRPAPTVVGPSAAQTNRRHLVPTVWIALAATVLLGAVAGIGYWLHPKQAKVAPEIALKTSPTISPPVTGTVSPRPPPVLVVGLKRLLGDKRPPDKPTAAPIAAPPGAAPAADAAAAVPVVPVPQALATEKPVATPADNVFVVRFDSELPGLTPSGLRTLNAALRAAEKGRKIRIEIAGCEDHDSVPTGIDCAALTRRLKWILADRGREHPATLIANLLHRSMSYADSP